MLIFGFVFQFQTRPHFCRLCGSIFSQKTNVITHFKRAGHKHYSRDHAILLQDADDYYDFIKKLDVEARSLSARDFLKTVDYEMGKILDPIKPGTKDSKAWRELADRIKKYKEIRVFTYLLDIPLQI